MLNHVSRFATFVLKSIVRYRCRENAAALTYFSLFAIVPLMTLGFAFFSVVPAFDGVGDQVEALIFKYFLPSTGQALQDHLATFSMHAKKLSWIGAIMLIVTCFYLLATIEKVFNEIWDVDRPRRGIARFMRYWIILSLGPPLLGVAMTASTYLLSMEIFHDASLHGVSEVFLAMLPIVVEFILFFLLFVAVPNAVVPWAKAVIGALLTTLLFELAKSLFAVVSTTGRVAIVYGAFAAVPILLLWLYISWMIILAGAVFVRCLVIYQWQNMVRHPALVYAIGLLYGFSERQKVGRGLSPKELLSGQVLTTGPLSVDMWHTLRLHLEREDIIARLDSGEYVLKRDLKTVTIGDIAKWFGADFTQVTDVSGSLQKQVWYNRLSKEMTSVSEQLQPALALPVESLFDDSIDLNKV